MGTGYLLTPLMLIINTLFDLYILLVLLRFLLQMLRADFYNPVSQFIVKVTTPPLRLLRRFIPSIAGQDTASIALCLILLFIKFLLMQALTIPVAHVGMHSVPMIGIGYGALLLYCVADLVSLTLTVFLFAIVIQVILSWVNPGHYNPVIGLVNKLAEPVLRPWRRLVPSIGGFDISPVFAILSIMVAKYLIIPPILLLAGI